MPFTHKLIRALIVAGVACVTFTSATVSSAQQPTTAQAVVEAGQLRDAGRFTEAVDTLRKHRELYPDDGDAIRMLAQTLYWIKDVPGARALYDSGLVIHPADSALRLQYARMLMETGSPNRAREVLVPLLAGATPDPGATELLGTMAYWEGDFTSARRLFEQALAADTSLSDAQRQLDEIRWLSATWIRTAFSGLSDDQPVKRVGGELETGYYITPLWQVIARAGSALLTEDTDTNPNRSPTDLAIFTGAIGVNGFIPSSRTDLSAEAGFFNRSVPSRLDWKGKAAVGMRLGSFARARVRVERTPYLYTEASLRTPVMTNTAAASLDIDNRGWLGRAAYELQRFPDDNSASTVYAWAMAPLVRAVGATLQAGYSVSYQNAQELRFVPNPSFDRQQGIPSAGHYEPYYTPRNTLIHSVIGAFTGSDGHGLVARFGGSYGFHATEDAPTFMVDASGFSDVLVISNRSFHPWTAHASVDKALTSRSALTARVEHAKTAVYHVTNAAVELTWRLASR